MRENPRLAFVVAGGHLRDPSRFRAIARAADLVLAADSGFDHLRRMDTTPDLLVGDMDSISPEALQAARDGAVRTRTFPSEKDFTDTELALRAAVDSGAECIIACAVLGDRLDHSLANLLLLASPALREHDIRMLDEAQEVRRVRGSVRMRTLPGEVVSLLPVGGRAVGVTTQGLYYPLDEACLETGPAVGVSNVAMGDSVEVRVREGLVLITRIFEGGLDAERYLLESGLAGE